MGVFQKISKVGSHGIWKVFGSSSFFDTFFQGYNSELDCHCFNLTKEPLPSLMTKYKKTCSRWLSHLFRVLLSNCFDCFFYSMKCQEIIHLNFQGGTQWNKLSVRIFGLLRIPFYDNFVIIRIFFSCLKITQMSHLNFWLFGIFHHFLSF